MEIANYTHKKCPIFQWGIPALTSRSTGDLAVHVAKYVPNLWTEQLHDSNHDDGHECENNRIFDKALSPFIWCKKHDEFLSKKSSLEKRPQALMDFTHSYYEIQIKNKKNT